ncbi:hypothetical protein K3163_04550 [Qipengyuania sp. 1NDW9]|uniref:hypothetical protein n=1 Tax=Qipengyuania xiapuensis TaxID=2867236 RepID=UPI001C87FAB8|nr:hypothetical protein [Qipengyuania xiapuensis]MBX7492473.1 hypothetical protein [Qipengyuania xiapuensis]
MTKGPKKPIDDPLVKAALLAAGAAWTVGMLATLGNSGKRRRFFDGVAKSMAENAGENWRKKLERKRKFEARKEEARQRDAYFREGAIGDILLKREIERSYRTLAPFPDQTFTKRNRPYGGEERRWSSAAAQAVFETEYNHWDGSHTWTLKIGKERHFGYVYGLSRLTIGPPTKAPRLSDRERETLLRLLGGPDGFPEVTFHTTDNLWAVRERLWAEHLASGN